jgi:hypothetical protein
MASAANHASLTRGPAHVGPNAQVAKDVPVPLARLDQLTMRLGEEALAKVESFRNRTRHLENTQIGRDPNDRAQHHGR